MNPKLKMLATRQVKPVLKFICCPLVRSLQSACNCHADCDFVILITNNDSC